MSFELGDAIRRCGLETGARRAVLDALACYTDETGLARVSRISVALHAGISEKTAYRVLSELCSDGELAGLVRRVRDAAGRGNPAVYRLDKDRLEALSEALKASGRRVFAGVGKRLADMGLIGKKASPVNIRAVFAALDDLLAEEGESVTRRLVQGHREAFEEALGRAGDVTVIGVPLIRKTDRSYGGQAVDKATVERGRKGDISSRKGDISSQRHYKDSSPSGNITFAREAPPVGIVHAAQAVSAGELIFSVEGLLSQVAVSRTERRQLIADLQGRIVRVSSAGVLAIRATDPGDGETVARWLEALRGWADVVGLAGVVVDLPFAKDGEG